MTAASLLALFGSMVVLALIPGPGILTVIARTLAAGLRHGASTAAGIVAGDFVFISFALLGLAALAQAMGGLFVVLKYLGAAYLVWLGVSLVFSKGTRAQVTPVSAPGYLASFAAGLLTTLGNPKAILFYFSFFPAFIDTTHVTARDAATLYGMAAVAVGGVMFGYAYLAYRAKSSLCMSHGGKILRYSSGALLVGSGVFVATRG